RAAARSSSLNVASQFFSGGTAFASSSQSDSGESEAITASPDANESSKPGRSRRTNASSAQSRAWFPSNSSGRRRRPSRAQSSSGQAVTAILAPGRQTRASSSAARWGSGAKMIPKAEAITSKSASP